MLITTNNQQPTSLQHFYLGSLSAQFDPYTTIMDNIVTPLFTPLVPNRPVTINKDGTDLSARDITDLLINCSDEHVNPNDEDCMKEIFNQTLVHYDKALNVQDVYAVQAAKKNNMPIPSSRVIYTTNDVIDTSKEFLAGQVTYDAYFATMAFYTRVYTFGYYFANAEAWNEFKKWFGNEIAQISAMLSADTMKLCNDLQAISLQGLTESFVIRDDTSQNNEPYSFARLMIFYLNLYEKTLQTNKLPEYIAGHLPFSFAENFCPTSVVIINVEKHAHANPNEIKNEWDIIKASMQIKPKIYGTNQIKKLTSVARMTKKLASMSSKGSGAVRSAIIKFRKTPMTAVDFYKEVMKYYKHMQCVIQSENEVRFKKTSYNRPSRRDPDNPDKMGIVHGIKYKPDFHIYLDCSGSISERNYQDAIKSCIKFAKRIGVDIYFTSFSDILSATTKLPVKGKTLRQIYDAFKNTPKVGGGTNYEQIWHYINQSKRRQKEFSIVITDFEYYAPNHYVTHPQHLYYAPISGTDWSSLLDSAKSFAKSMLSICPDIRKKFLM